MPDESEIGEYSPPFNPTGNPMFGLESLPVAPTGGSLNIPNGAGVPLPGTGYRANLPAGSDTLSPDQLKSQILAHIRKSEGADYDTLYGGGRFNSFAAHPNVGFVGPTGLPTHAAGGYQFEPGTWNQQAKKLGLNDFSPQSQDVAAWDLAQRTYKQQTGRDILVDAQQGKVNWEALGGEWEGLKGKGRSSTDIRPQTQTQAQAQAQAQASTAAPAASPESKLMRAMLLMHMMAPNHKFISVDYDPFKTQPKV